MAATKFVVVAKVRLVCPEATLSRTVPEAVADTEGRGFAMSGAVSQLIGHLWGEVVKHGPTVRPFASANAESLSSPTRHPRFQRRPLSVR